MYGRVNNGTREFYAPRAPLFYRLILADYCRPYSIYFPVNLRALSQQRGDVETSFGEEIL